MPFFRHFEFSLSSTRGHAYKLYKLNCSSARAIYFACIVINVRNSFPFTVSFTAGFKLLLLLTYCMIGGFWGVGVGELTTHFVRVIRVLVFDYAFHLPSTRSLSRGHVSQAGLFAVARKPNPFYNGSVTLFWKLAVSLLAKNYNNHGTFLYYVHLVVNSPTPTPQNHQSYNN